MDHYLQLGGRIGSADEPMLEGYTTVGYLAASTSTVELQLLVTGVTYRHPGLLAKIDQLATAVEPAAPADHDRRRRGDEDPAAGRQVRRRMQPLRWTQRRAGRGEGQVGRAARALRAREGTDYDRIRKTILYVGPLQPDDKGGKDFADQMARYADVGVEEVHVMPYGPDPVGFVRGLVRTSSRPSAERLPDEQLVVPHPVIVACVEERHPGVERGLDRGDRLHLIRRAVEVGHPHAAQAERRDAQAGPTQYPSRSRTSSSSQIVCQITADRFQSLSRIERRGRRLHPLSRDQLPNQRCRRVAANSAFSTARSAEGPRNGAVGAGPDKKSASTLPTKPPPNSM